MYSTFYRIREEIPKDTLLVGHTELLVFEAPAVWYSVIAGFGTRRCKSTTAVY
jgi:hypothetical protein